MSKKSQYENSIYRQCFYVFCFYICTLIQVILNFSGVKADPKRKTVAHHDRSSNPFQDLSKLNNQTKSTIPSLLDIPLPRNTQLKTQFKSSQSNTHHTQLPIFDNPQSYSHSPSAVLNISDLSIGNHNSTKNRSQEIVHTATSDFVSDNLQSTKRRNQTDAKSDGANQSAETSRNSANEEMNNSLIIVSDNVTCSASPGKLYVCTVLHCEAVFTSEAKLNHHMNQFSHSPCNPCLRVKDGKLLPDPLCYMCPRCDQDFKVWCYFYYLHLFK